MKANSIHTVVLEGCDGVGKSSLLYPLLAALDYRFVILDRGEMSDLVFSKVYNRNFVCCQRHQPILYVLITCDEKVLSNRIYCRGMAEHWNISDINKELSKIKQQPLFIQAAKDMSHDYHVITIDNSKLTKEQTLETVKKAILEYCDTLAADESVSEWNKMYDAGCKKLGLRFSSRANQPYINDIAFMSESTLQNGVYETYDNRSYPDNLIFMFGYDLDTLRLKEKDVEFAYVINSKIRQRPEVYEYYKTLDDAGVSFLTSTFDEIPEYEHRVKMSRVFGNGFIEELSRAKFTVYCSRDLAYLELQTARLYESILANEIVFVDAETDRDNKILKQIYPNDEASQQLFRVTPETIVEKYKAVSKDDAVMNYALAKQHQYFEKIKSEINKNKFAEVKEDE